MTSHRAKEFAPTPDEKWVEEFENQFTSKNKRLADVAKEMTETVTDPEIKGTEVSRSELRTPEMKLCMF